MKRFFFLSLTVLGLATLSSCSKDTEPSPAPYVAQSNAMTGNVDGTALTIVDFSSQNPSVSLGSQEMTFLFYTKADLTEYVVVNVPVTIVNGTYALTEDGLESIGYQDAAGAYISTSGTLQIASHDKTNHVLRGTFEASMIPTPTSTATSTHDFTNVSFTINY